MNRLILNNFFRKRIVIILLTMTLVACSSSGKIITPGNEKSILQEIQNSIDLTRSKDELIDDVQKIKTILKKKEFAKDDIQKIEIFYKMYESISRLAQGQEVLLFPRTSLKIGTKSFCLSPNKATPSEYELFNWKKGEPEIPYYTKIIQFIGGSSDYTQDEIQTLIWNLSNEAYYSNYPPKLQKLLKKIDESPERKLPSETKDLIRDKAKSLIGNILPQAQDQFDIIQGHYYDYENIADVLEERKSKYPINASSKILLLQENPTIYVSTVSDGFSSQKVTFFNPNYSLVSIDLSQYYLIPLRDDIQEIGIYVDTIYFNRLKKVLDNSLKDTIIRNSQYWYHDRLTTRENQFIKEHPVEALEIYVQAKNAEYSTLKYFHRNGEDDESDAFRHFIWAGLSVKEIGESNARKYLVAHEFLQDRQKNSISLKAQEMDLYNNEQGIAAALKLQKENQLTFHKLEEAGIAALRAGKLQVNKPTGNNIWYD